MKRSMIALALFGFLTLTSSAHADGCKIGVETKLNGEISVLWKEVKKEGVEIQYSGTYQTPTTTYEISAMISSKDHRFDANVSKDDKILAGTMSNYPTPSQGGGAILFAAVDDPAITSISVYCASFYSPNGL